jgi:cytochrome c-type biogenesis protein CcmF
VFIGGSLALFAWRAPRLKQGGLFAPISRESALVFNNLFLATACATVFVGTLYPLVLEMATGDKISVGAPFFNLTFGPLFVPLLIAVPFGPLLAWKRGDLYGVAQRLLAACAVAMAGLAAVFAFNGVQSVLAPFGIGLALFVMAGALTDIAERIDLRSMSIETIGRRAAGMPRSSWGTAVAHFALGITLLGIVSASTWGSERIVALKPSQTVSISGYDLVFDGMVSRDGSNYRETAAHFTVRKQGAVIGIMEPSKRVFPSRDGMSTTEAALLTRGVSQLYLSLGDNNADGSIAVRLYHKPLVLLIWLGALVMALGGALSLSDRRLRIGAPKPAARIVAQPAE